MTNKEKILEEMNKLNIELNDLKEQIDFLDRNGASFEEKRILIEIEHSLRHRVLDLQEKLVFILPPANTNGIIDLRRCDEYSYYICLYNTDIIIGQIQYRGYHVDSYFGDVGYGIDSEYRGNKYAYQALVLLSEILYEKGITDFWISTYRENIPSVKTIERYGGILMDKDDNYEFVNLYMCQTLKKLEKNEENSKKI